MRNPYIYMKSMGRGITTGHNFYWLSELNQYLYIVARFSFGKNLRQSDNYTYSISFDERNLKNLSTGYITDLNEGDVHLDFINFL